ncbi:MAG: G/U mismatch-specific DNA glycosylase [Gemmataceae bacterium]
MTKPTRADLDAAAGRTIADVIAHGLRVLFVGINPGLYSAAIGHHFGRPGNRFWPALHRGGFTPRQFSPYEERDLLPLRLGITNIVTRASARADELSAEELVAGAAVLRKKVLAHRPGVVAILGVTAYRAAFQDPKAALGPHAAVGDSAVWVLPNPSGLNAHYTLAGLADLFRALNEAAGE